MIHLPWFDWFNDWKNVSNITSFDKAALYRWINHYEEYLNVTQNKTNATAGNMTSGNMTAGNASAGNMTAGNASSSEMGAKNIS